MESERGHEKGKDSGGKEGAGGGDDEGDGGKDPGKSAKVDSGKGFTFGKTPEGERSAKGGPNGSPVTGLRNSVPTFSYRDKLLSPGGVGFLVKQSEDDDIMQGWKEYFHKMNEKDSQCDLDESDDDDNLEARRMEGKPGKLNFTAEEYAAWYMPWMNSLIIKVLGATFPTYMIRDRINRMWRPKDPLKLIPLSNGYFIVSFSNKEDRAYAFQEGPWMIEDHYLTVQRWRPNFNPHKADIQCNIAAWVRLPDVPFEFYNVESLRRIGNMIGEMIKIDRSTSIYDKGGFARICVEIDLKKPLLPSYLVFGEERSIVYEGLHQVCFKCGQYGHQKIACPTELSQSNLLGYEHGTEKASTGGDGDNNVEKVGEQGSEKANVEMMARVTWRRMLDELTNRQVAMVLGRRDRVRRKKKGIGAKSFPALVREPKGHYKLDFFVIVETRCSKEMSVTRANQLGFLNMELVDCYRSRWLFMAAYCGLC
ncbi:hypothetical protein K1719_016225 [Acacia pycnantha]|nr:hypothetical protein K1719_016225 [Acacia pycnantha]